MIYQYYFLNICSTIDLKQKFNFNKNKNSKNYIKMLNMGFEPMTLAV